MGFPLLSRILCSYEIPRPQNSPDQKLSQENDRFPCHSTDAHRKKKFLGEDACPF